MSSAGKPDRPKALPKHASKKEGSSKDSSGKRQSNTSKKNGGDKLDSGEQLPLEVKCAIYTPHEGNYYHWALAIYNSPGKRWDVFEVVQEDEGPFIPVHHHKDPLQSQRCFQPLTELALMNPGWLDVLKHRVSMIQVPGEAEQWNCQDYVMEIWDIMNQEQMIEDNVYEQGKQVLMPFYGQDFGGEKDGDYEEEYGAYEQGEEEYEQEGQHGEFKSEEFVYDSDE